MSPVSWEGMSATTLRLFRKTHLYFGLFISPALLFFAFTGAVQTLSLHEIAGSSYKTTVMPVRKAPEGGQAHDGGHADHAGAPASAPQPTVTLAGKQRQHLPMKIFFLVVAVGLLTSTATGIYMSYKYERSKLLVTGALVAGVVVPMVLLKF
jgi:hypothetical protein